MSRFPRDRAAEYRRQAQQNRAIAARRSLQDIRKQLIETVCRLEALALEQDRRGKRTTPVPSSHPGADAA